MPKWIVTREHAKMYPIDAERFRVHDSGCLLLFDNIVDKGRKKIGEQCIAAFKDWRHIVEEKND